MSTRMIINWTLIAVYFLIVLLIGFISSRRKSSEDYMIRKRELGTFALAFTIAASMIGGNTLITYTALIYEYGIAILWGFTGIAFGLWILAKIGKKLKEKGKIYYTMPDFYFDNYGRKTGLIVTVIAIFWYSMVLLVQYIVGGEIISALVDIPYWASVLIMGLIVFIYSYLGGFNAVVRTDVFQYLLFIILAVFEGISMIRGKIIEPSQFNIMSFGIGKTIAFFILGITVIVVGPGMWQRVYAARDKKVIAQGFSIATVALLLAFLAIGMIGMAAATTPDIPAEESLLYGVKNLLPARFLGLTFILLFAVIMSSLDTVLFVLATNFAEGIVIKNINPAFDRVKYTRAGMFIFALILMLIAIFVQDVVSIGLAMLSLGLAFVPVIVGTFFFKKQLKRKAVQLSSIVGFVAVLVVLFMGFIGPETSAVSLPVATIFLIIGQLIWRKAEA